MQKSEWLERMRAQQRRFEDLNLLGLAKWTNMMTKFMNEHCPDGEICTTIGDDADPIWPLPLLEEMPDNLDETDLSLKDMNEFFIGGMAHAEETEKQEAANTKEAGQ
jgi:hypothetical protein